jgi:hypothetical protein
MTREEFISQYIKAIYRFAFIKCNISVRLNNKLIQDMPGIEFNSLVLHRTPYLKKTFSVSLDSGYRVLGPYKTKREAKVALVRLATVIGSRGSLASLKHHKDLIAKLQKDPFFQ